MMRDWPVRGYQNDKDDGEDGGQHDHNGTAAGG